MKINLSDTEMGSAQCHATNMAVSHLALFCIQFYGWSKGEEAVGMMSCIILLEENSSLV
jgi:hypothetical protein